VGASKNGDSDLGHLHLANALEFIRNSFFGKFGKIKN
jgi:hypothetical protein